MVKIVSKESLLAARRQGTITYEAPFIVNGHPYVATVNLVNGEMEVLELTRPIGEMLTSDTSRRELVEKITLDVALGREAEPLVYQPIYEELTNPDFPETLTEKWGQRGVVVFSEHTEGQEVRFGSLAAEKGPTARISCYTAGIEYTKEMKEFNKTWSMEMMSRAAGEGFNALLNHLHLGPFLVATYGAGNTTGPVYRSETDKELPDANGRHYILSLRATLEAAIKAARVAGRPGSILLINSADLDDVQAALARRTINGNELDAIQIGTIITYDGWADQVSKKQFVYPGVTQGEGYLIRPRGGFKSLVKADLTVESSIGDVSRLVEAQFVWWSFRGVYAAIGQNVQKITFPS